MAVQKQSINCIAFALWFLIHLPLTVSSLNNIQHNYDLLHRGMVTVKVMDMPNQVHMSVLNQKYEEFREEQDNFLSATMEFTLHPVKHEMDDSQKREFEQQTTSFLKSSLASQVEHPLNILAVTVTSSERNSKLDVKGGETSADRYHTLQIVTVISAQQNLSSAKLTSDDFGEMLTNLCSIYKNDLVQKLKEKDHEVLIQQNTAGITDGITDHLLFYNVRSVEVAIHKQSNGTTGMTRTGKLIFGCFIGILIAFTGILLYLRSRRSQLHEGLEDYGNTTTVKEYLTQNKHADLPSAPYGDVQLTPPKTQRKNMHSQVNTSDDNSINTFDVAKFPNTPLSERYESGMDYDDGDDRTMPTIGRSLSADGSLFKGECFAPVGKLGIAIDTVNGQPVIHRVREESPLAGVLRRLDVIIAIDDEDTSSMTAADVTTLMARKMDKRRKITFIRGKRAVEILKTEII